MPKPTEAAQHDSMLDVPEGGDGRPLAPGDNSGPVAAEELKLLIERIERMEEEKKGIADDVKDVYGEAKARGYDTKTMRVIIKLRKQDKDARAEAEALLETYKAAVGLD